jgi:hypothetical protein
VMRCKIFWEKVKKIKERLTVIGKIGHVSAGTSHVHGGHPAAFLLQPVLQLVPGPCSMAATMDQHKVQNHDQGTNPYPLQHSLKQLLFSLADQITSQAALKHSAALIIACPAAG